MKAVIYTRISVDRDDETSTDSQQREAEALAASKGWDVVSVEVDKGRSAFHGAKRPGLERAMRKIRAGAADVLIVWAIDRLARNTRHLLEIVEELREHDADLAVVTQPIDTTNAFGEVVLTILGAVAQLESRMKSERTASWHAHRRGEAKPPTGRAPLGYDREADGDGGTLVLNDTAPLVADAASRVLAGESVRSLSREMEVPHNVLTRTLLNPTIAAHVDIDGELAPGDWEPIIPLEQHEALVAMFADRRTGAAHDRRWMLGGTGVFTCTCGGTVSSKSGGGTRGTRYTCKECHRSVDAITLDEHMSTVILGLLDRPTWDALRSRGQRPSIDTADLEDRIVDLKAMFDADEITFDEWREMRSAVTKKAQAARYDEPVELPDVEDLHASWASLTASQRSLVVAAVVERIELLPGNRGSSIDERISVTWAA